eukprot:6276178-Pyramimonas_sp.AAC.1
MERNEVIPMGLANDNWYGYVEKWIHEKNVTWMEKTCASRCWTGLMLFSIDVRQAQRSKRPKHLLHAPLFQNEGRVAYKGQ